MSREDSERYTIPNQYSAFDSSTIRGTLDSGTYKTSRSEPYNDFFGQIDEFRKERSVLSIDRGRQVKPNTEGFIETSLPGHGPPIGKSSVRTSSEKKHFKRSSDMLVHYEGGSIQERFIEKKEA